MGQTKKILLIFLTCWISTSFALTQFDSEDNQTISASISTSELNQISVSNDRIQSVRGLDGRYDLTKDEKEGMIFIKPTEANQNKPLSLFITTEEGRSYGLHLTPKKQTAEIIQINPLTPSKTEKPIFEKELPYEDTLLQLFQAMIHNETPQDFIVKNENYPALGIHSSYLSWQRIRTYHGNGLIGDIWCLCNRGKQPIHLNPLKFYNDNVRAISFRDDVLMPNSNTLMYRILSA